MIAYEEVYRLALQLPPDERLHLVQALADSPSGLTVEEIIQTLNTHAARLRELGVQRIGVFGSHVQGQARLDSDIDFLVEMSTGDYTLFDLGGVHRFLQDVFGREVDVVPADSIRPELEQHICAGVIYAEGI
ncbi:MAG: nucleotidyltransferase family protein [Anaerolineae bacterium]|nr:nucleotidyltransferase family protein [Anaerolineae bacterium]